MKTELRSGAIVTTAWCALALAFPWSNAFMSIAIGALALAALLRWFSPLKKPSSGPLHPCISLTGWALIALVVYSALSSAWSASPSMAIDDARIKLPLFVGGMALLLSRKMGGVSFASSRVILKCAIVSASAATLAIIGLDLIEGAPFGGRASSRFISHIRFGLWWALLLPWVAAALPRVWLWLGVVAALATWTWTESLNGIIMGYATAAWWGPALWRSRDGALVMDWPKAKQVGQRLCLLGLVAALISAGLWRALPTDYPDSSVLMEFSPSGERYVHVKERRVQENGNFVWVNIAWGELAHAWRGRHSEPFDSVQGRLIRFLASKGLTKDREGVAALSAEEVEAIASGIASEVEWKQVGWARRWNRICFNWGNSMDGKSHGDSSILARMTFQSVAWRAIAQGSWRTLIFGAGTGSQQAVLTSSYDRCVPDWPEAERKRPHNQYFSLVLGMGILGLLLWLLTLSMGQVSTQAWPGLLLLMLSCLVEDTLETQAGVTLAVWAVVFPAFTLHAWGRTKQP